MNMENSHRAQTAQEQNAVTVPVKHVTGWVDQAVLSIATACNLCDVYVHDQVRFEWNNENQDVQLDSSSFEDVDRRVQIEVYKKFLFDESSIRLEDVDDGPERS
jgi:hypothetical protein